MLKRIAAAILLMAFVVQTFSAPFIRLDYFFNQADYAKNCVNKARPKMHCNGRCQVMKKILAEEKEKQQADERKMGSKLEVISSKSFFTSTIAIVSVQLQNTFYIIDDKSSFDISHAVFHPPTSRV